MTIPPLDLRRQYAPLRQELLAQIERVFDSGQFILGPDVEALEREVAAYLGVRHALGVSNGTDALTMALKAVGVKAGDRVLTTPFTFFATVSSIAAVGAIPEFADIDPVTFNLDPEKARAALQADVNHTIRAIVPVHLYGHAAEMDAIQSLAKEYEIPVIEDAAQAIGASWKERRVGSWGNAACFSFFPTKNLGAIGDAGLVTTEDPELFDRLKKIRNHGSEKKYHHELLGGNFRIDTLQAAALRVFLPHLDGWIADRRQIAEKYRAGLSQLAPRIVVPSEHPDAHHAYHQYTIRISRTAHPHSRATLQEFLQSRHIASTVYYPIPCHKQQALAPLISSRVGFPESESASEEVLSLPIFPGMTDEEIRTVVDAVHAWAVI